MIPDATLVKSEEVRRSRLDEIIQMGRDTVERIKYEQLEMGRLTDLAVSYGMTYREFASKVDYDAKRINEYMNMVRYFNAAPEWTELHTHSLFTYTHFREAKRLNDLSESIAALDHCLLEGWRVPSFRNYIDMLLTGVPQPMVWIAWDSTTEVLSARDASTKVYNLLRQASGEGKKAWVKVYYEGVKDG